MSDERTLAPGRRRRRQAREAGRVAHSPELTAAAGLLATSALFGLWGDDLLIGLIDLVRAPLLAEPGLGLTTPSAGAVAAAVRASAGRVILPLLGLVVGSAALMAGVHLLQVGFLVAPSRLAPDPARLIGGLASPSDPTAAVGRATWSVAKAAVLVVAAGWTLGADLSAFARLAALGPNALASACGSIAGDLLRTLGVALAALGVADYLLRRRRLEASLRLTPEEGRQEQRELEGDPALRNRRRTLARSWRRDPGDLPAGASLLLTGPPGLAVLLGGGPPPDRPISVRRVARGRDAFALRRAAEGAGIAVAEVPELAAFLARGPSSAGSLPPALAAALAARWPPEVTTP